MPHSVTPTSFGQPNGNDNRKGGAALGNANRDTVYRKRMQWLARQAARSERLRRIIVDEERNADGTMATSDTNFLRAVELVSDRAGSGYERNSAPDADAVIRVIVERVAPATATARLTGTVSMDAELASADAEQATVEATP